MDRLYASRCGVCAADQRQDIARFLLSDRVLEAILRRIQGGFNVREEIDHDLFRQAKEMLDEAIGQSFDLSTEWGKEDLAFIAELRHNAGVFAAFKAHREQNDIAALLLDEEGKPRSFDAFRKATEPVIGQYNVNWLRTEYTAAIRNARTARRFRAYQKDADLFPNLRWLKSRAAEPRFSHRKYYNTIRRIDDPWWLTHYPGCVWNCQCDMEQTADPITHVGNTPAMPGKPSTKPGSEGEVRAPGLSQNPALSKSLFSQDHPYFTAAYPGAKEAVENKIQAIDIKQARKEVQEWAKKEVVGKSFLNKEMGKAIEITSTGIKEALNQPHKFIREKNEAIRDIQRIIRESHLVLYRPDDKGNQMVAGYHYLEFELAGEKSYIVIRETKDGRLMFYSVVDKIKGR